MTPLVHLKGAFRDIKSESQDTDQELGTLYNIPSKLNYFYHTLTYT